MKKTKFFETSPLLVKFSRREESKVFNDQQNDASCRKINILQLFRYTTKSDICWIMVGFISTVVNGISLPWLALTFGHMTDIFAKYAPELVEARSKIVDPDFLRFNNSVVPVEEHFVMLKLVKWICVEYTVIGVIVFIATFIQVFIWEMTSERQIFVIRRELFYHLLRQQRNWFKVRDQDGQILANKLATELEIVREGLGSKLSLVIQHLVTFVIGLAVGFYTSWELTLLALLFAAFNIRLTWYIRKLSASLEMKEEEEYQKAEGIVIEVITNIKTDQNMAKVSNEIERYQNFLKTGLQLATKRSLIVSFSQGILYFAFYVAYAFVFWLGSFLLVTSRISAGGIFVILLAVVIGGVRLGNALTHFHTIGKALDTAAQIFHLIDSIPSIDAYAKDGFLPREIQGRLEFKSVNFRYPGTKLLVLDDISFEVAAGSTVGILMDSHNSIIPNLVQRVYDTVSGRIILDDIELNRLNLSWLRSKVGVVSGEPVLFPTSILDNIRLGREDATFSEVIEAAKVANIHDFIESLPEGYHAVPGYHEVRLSDGQMQQIVIARAIIRSPTILLLHEPTTSLNPESIIRVQEALKAASQGRTTIITSHRLVTVMDADVIYVIKNGKIIEHGRHEDLIKQKNYYYEMLTAQTSQDTINMVPAEAVDSIYTLQNEENIAPNEDKLPDIETINNLQPKISNFSILSLSWQRLVKLNRLEQFCIVLGFLSYILLGLSFPLVGVMYGQMYLTLSTQVEGLPTTPLKCVVMFLGIAIICFLLACVGNFLIAMTSDSAILKIRVAMFTSITSRHVSWFDKQKIPPDSMILRLAREALLLKDIIGLRPAKIMMALVSTLTGLGIPFIFGWQLSLVSLVSFLIIMISSYVKTEFPKPTFKKSSQLIQNRDKITAQAIQSISTVQSLGIERIFFEGYLDITNQLISEVPKQVFLFTGIVSFAECALYLLYALEFYYGAYLVSLGDMTTIQVYTIFFCMCLSASGVGMILANAPDYDKANIISEEILKINQFHVDNKSFQ